MRPTTEVLDPEIARRLFYEDGDPVAVQYTLAEQIERAYDDSLPDSAWRYDNRKINPQLITAKVGFPYALHGNEPDTGIARGYIGATADLAKANKYWGSGVGLPDDRSEWMSRNILEFVPACDVFKREFEIQLEMKVLDNNKLTFPNGFYLNYQIGDLRYKIIRHPEFQKMINEKLVASAKGNERPILVAYKDGDVRTFPSMKLASRHLGIAENASTLRTHLTGYRNGANFWSDKGIQFVCYLDGCVK